tara:strand:- start:4466 stop:5179 length:714 start_codon:yes stop_codon:yes gene_type:complete
MLLTIITVTYNCALSIDDTLSSVVNAKKIYPDLIEYVVMDGGSNDTTCNIINKYKSSLDIYISEKDSGIYNAMNKGVRKSTGDWLLFLNDGDLLLDVVGLISLLLTVNNNVGLVSFPVNLSNGKQFIPEFNWKLKLHNTLHHQGTCYRRNSFPKYNEYYKIFSDFDINQKYLKKQATVLIGSNVHTFHSLDGASNQKGSTKELFKIIKTNYGSLFLIASYFRFKIVGVKCRIIRLFS